MKTNIITKTLQHQNNCINVIKMYKSCLTSAFSHRTTSWNVTRLVHEPHYRSSSLNSQVGHSGCHKISVLGKVLLSMYIRDRPIWVFLQPMPMFRGQGQPMADMCCRFFGRYLEVFPLICMLKYHSNNKWMHNISKLNIIIY